MRQATVRWPAEWEPHEGTWLARPHHSADWPGKLAAIRWVYVEMLRALHTHETVNLLVENAAGRDGAKRFLSRGGVDIDRIKFHLRRTDRSWVRDSGPTFVERDGRLGAVCWRFNAWAKYSNFKLDQGVGRFVAKRANAEIDSPTVGPNKLVLEGGAIDGNGRGTLLATEECLLSNDKQVRNPGVGRDEIEQVLRESLGAKKVLWLGKGIAGDDTHGHVDDLARFVAPRRVVTVVETDSRDENFGPLRDNLQRLKRMTDQDGRPVEVVELPMPKPLYFEGLRLPASYANFYIANGIVLVPTFNDPHDRIALGILAECFPDREVRGIHSVDMVWGFGTIHCSTQQQPRIA